MSEEKQLKFEGFIKHLAKRKLTLVYFLLVFLVLGVGLSLLKPLEYSSKVSLLIIQKINPNLDAYTAARAAEKLGKNLSTIIYTTSFFDKVRHSNFNLNLDLLADERARRKDWQEKIVTKMLAEGSILEITAYDKNRQEAEKLANVIAYILASEGQEYHGGGDDIVIKQVNSALTSSYPTRPNLILNGLISIILGIIGGLLIVFWQYSRKVLG